MPTNQKYYTVNLKWEILRTYGSETARFSRKILCKTKAHTHNYSQDTNLTATIPCDPYAIKN